MAITPQPNRGADISWPPLSLRTSSEAVHATVEWRGGHFVLSDASSFGTWIYMGNQTEPFVLRRTECYLVGQGEITLGCEREAEGAPAVLFSVTA